MIYPKNFESKIGFTEIRRLLRGECLSTLGSGKVDEIGFSDDAATYERYSAAELEAMGLTPAAMAPFTRDYSFTVDHGGSFAEIPVVSND